MRLEDSAGAREIVDESEICEALSQSRGSTEIWLSHGDEKYPALAILLTGTPEAVLHYFPSGAHPGFVGRCPQPTTPEIGRAFHVASGDPVVVEGRYIVSIDVAIRAARAFLVSNAPPSCIEWLEL
jgi:hypothetical protein